MFNKVLIPTDGSEISTAAAMEGIAFAADNNAAVVGIYVAPEYQYPVYVEVIPPTYPVAEEYATLMKKMGNDYLQPLEEAAKKTGLTYVSEVVFANSPGQAIAKAAEQHVCDLIFMGSHGRYGLGQLLLGSVTTKVLSLCHTPVMVYRKKN